MEDLERDELAVDDLDDDWDEFTDDELGIDEEDRDLEGARAWRHHY